MGSARILLYPDLDEPFEKKIQVSFEKK